jgi:hypothetical protein
MSESGTPLDPRQETVDGVVTSWPGVKAKNVFGHRGYVRDGRMFGFLARGGVAVKALTPEDADALYSRDGVVAFTYNEMPMKGWPILPLRDDSELEAALTELDRCYQGA